MTTPPQTTVLGLIPTDTSAPHETPQQGASQTDTTGLYAKVPLTPEERLVLDALTAKAPDGLRGSEAATLLGVNRLYAGRVCKMLVRPRLATRVGRSYHIRKGEEK